MIGRLAIVAPLLLAALPAAAQDHSAHARPVDNAEAGEAAEHALPDERAPVPADLAEIFGTPPMDHAGHGADVPAGPPPADAFEGPRHAADTIYDPERMARARAQSRATHGGMKTGMVMAERLEARLGGGEELYLWDLQGWYGGDIDKLVVKSEGEGTFGGDVDDAEIQALWGHAIGPWFDLQAGARLDIEPGSRSHLVLGVQGLAPYMWHVDAAAFLSDRGDLTARVEGEWDWKLTQRLILQPRAEFDLSAQAVPERELGSGLTKLETGLRLRYEFAREFAPYVGVGYEAKLGKTADLARAAGEDPDGLAVLVGLRAWF